MKTSSHSTTRGASWLWSQELRLQQVQPRNEVETRERMGNQRAAQFMAMEGYCANYRINRHVVMPSRTDATKRRRVSDGKKCSSAPVEWDSTPRRSQRKCAKRRSENWRRVTRRYIMGLPWISAGRMCPPRETSQINPAPQTWCLKRMRTLWRRIRL